MTVFATFANDQVTLTGVVPSQKTADRVAAFAEDFSLAPVSVVNQLTIDPDAPRTGGVRIVEYNAIGFNEGSEVVQPDHGIQLDRFVGPMILDPTLTLHVIGNTDDRGEETVNLAISQRRATAVANYIADQGIDRDRLTTEPAGESNILSSDATEEAYALNRRVDFVLFGLLAD